MEGKSSLNVPEERHSTKSSEKLKMLDITRDKPVKVAVKVAVPVRDHPKFNFVGKLLGPKGNSMKRLQEDTMCKMAVLGRGSMRDRRKEEELRASGDSRYAHLFEDLHVEISTFAAPAEAHARIAYALAEVRRFLVPDYHDEIRQEQMWEMQALTSTPTLSHLDDSQSPTNRGLGGGLADMDTSNDDKSDNEASVSGMDCISPDKLDCSQSCNSNEHHQPTHFHQLLQAHGHSHGHAHGHGAATAVAAGLTGGCGDHMPGQTPSAAATALHTTAMAVALQHQLTAAGIGIGGLLKPAAGTGATMAGLPSTQPNASGLQMPGDADPTTSALTLLDPPGTLLHPALRSVKAINIGSGLGRKRPLLGVPRTGMNPTKRTVMSLLARAKNSQSLHSVRSPVVTTASFADPIQMLASPFIIPHQTVDQSIIALPKESLAQGV
ncbi:branchpoint-bridging protein [Scaptodrosophila lebanonensis]|uniref:Branchpoint-bridging protein n=1 Tax=Drosophila lebanonensis TaxID=7225 RepID=A0A6J2TPH7_DROLE|nr:branchpoint-bridging protein [Scaptodrosophila lebanonensis]